MTSVTCPDCGWVGDEAELLNEAGNTAAEVDAGGEGAYSFTDCPQCDSPDVDIADDYGLIRAMLIPERTLTKNYTRRRPSDIVDLSDWPGSGDFEGQIPTDWAGY